MLRNHTLSNKTFENRISEGIMQIPLYTSEWTNFNPSDPGITILENLSLFETLQQDHIMELPPDVKAGLLKMVGFTPIKGRNSRVLLMPEHVDDTMILPRGQRFFLDDISFETRKEISLNGCKLLSVWSHLEDNWTEMHHLADRDINLPDHVFGENPQVGAELYLFFNFLPESGEEAIFYFEIEESDKRNEFENREYNLFASLKWEVYGKDGFQEINAIDKTGGFITSGEVVLRFPEYEAAEYDERGYVIRATLEKSDYDIPPVIRNVYAFLFEVWQQQTEVVTFTGKKGTSIETPSSLANDHYISVFAKEEGEEHYRHYELAPDSSAKGRLFEVKDDGEKLIYKFNRKKYGYAPVRGKAAVRIIAYTPEIMQQYHIGQVEGYDDQIIELPVKNIIADSFFVIARMFDENGEKYYEFVRPGRSEEGKLNYLLFEREGYLLIKEAGDFLGAELFMGGCSTYLGAAGNIRMGNYLKAEGLPASMRFFNPCPGTGGRFLESLEEVRRRFVQDIDTPFAAVTAKDYESIVLDTPGLCIRKAKAYINTDRNEVKIAVLPGNENDRGLPVLTSDYETILKRKLEERRLLTTKISLMKPQYEKVNVKAVVYVEQYFERGGSRIEDKIRQVINYVDGTKNFGEPLLFQEVFEAIEEEPGVEFVSKLKLTPSRSKYVTVQEESIYPNDDVVLIPGLISVELIPYHK